MLTIRDLIRWLPESVIELYEALGIDELYPPQAEAIERGLLDGRNMIISVPTAAGKTLLAELAMLRGALSGKRSLYIVPLRALASEKFESFSRFSKLGLRVGISTGDFEKRDERLGRNDIIIATSEKADSLIRNGASWVRRIGVLVVDEIHLLDSANRGPTLEMTMTKLMHLNPEMQVIGLSATIANGREIADWIKGEIVSSDWRPVRLREGVLLEDRLVFPDGEIQLENRNRDPVLNLVLDTVDQGGQMLIFESTRRNAESMAKKVSGALQESGETIELAERLSGEGKTAKKLAMCLRHGAAFHHAGLLPEQRRLIELGFRQNVVKVIACTPTLAAGLNLPARRVLIRSYKRYEAGLGTRPIPVMEYRQMAGRAGRPGLDPYGESLIMARSESELQKLMDHYVMGEPEDIWSKLASERALRTHVLATIASRFADSVDSLSRLMASTFYARQQDPSYLGETIASVLEFLVRSDMIDKDLTPTPLGALVSRLYIDPLSAMVMIQEIRGIRRPTVLTLLHVITMTPDMELLFVQQSDNWLEDFISEHSSELGNEKNFDWLLREVKTASMLMDWINEVHEDRIEDRYSISPGDLVRIAETAEWLMSALHRISKHMDLGVTYLAERLALRIHYGAGDELLQLLELKGIGRVRARKLYQAGYRSLEDLKAADKSTLSEILGPKIAEGVISQLKEPGVSA
ncbi:ATP-dependent DNA helicase [Methanothrix thermoacetophila]|uniref:ATP-dependent DNA helicase Hel308 n=1 Tax=Methanothrix thermoacetophila (strain DSM 6194 / JCM 14653 / NBRC 101360 / PT) TaxID=349307 RepID=A0B7B5_METTP|nr:ATP-dependent DNA helicase [Methanothrix thermoacetophila]ABK14589.1 DEAD/DEAH box helicase domain protein [Methanothrix thermoacetophila PT]